MVDRNRVLENAQKLVAKGSFDKAIAQYQLLVDDDPRDVRTLLKIGDLHTKTGARDRAVESYGRVATQYANQGFFLKAVAVYKQILKLDPSSIATQLKLAGMYEQLDLVSDALNTYEQVAALYARAGDLDQAIATLSRMAELDPENVPVRIKYAEALSKLERTEEAAREFEVGARLLRSQGRLDDYLKVAERLLFHRPDVAVSRDVAEMYLDRGDAKRALGKLQVCFQDNPKDVATLELLARAFLLLGQTAKTISVYREIARVYQEGKRPADRERVLHKILELDPNDDEAKTALGQKPPPPRDASFLFEVPPGTIMAPVSSAAAAAPPVEAPLPTRTMVQAPAVPPDSIGFDDDDAPELELLEDEFQDLPGDSDFLHPSATSEGSEPAIFLYDDETPPPRSAVRESLVDSLLTTPPEALGLETINEADEADQPGEAVQGYAGVVDPAVWPEVERMMADVESFLRFGLVDKTQAKLEDVVNLAPDYMLARQMLSDAYIQQGLLDDASQQLLDMALICRDVRPELSVMYLNAVLDIDPVNIDARVMLGHLSFPTAAEVDAPPPDDAPLEPHVDERLASPRRIRVSLRPSMAPAPRTPTEDAPALVLFEPDPTPIIQVSEAPPLQAPGSVRFRPSVPPPERVGAPERVVDVAPPMKLDGPSVEGPSDFPDALTIAPAPAAPAALGGEPTDFDEPQRDIAPEALRADSNPAHDEVLYSAVSEPDSAAVPPEEVTEGLEEADFFVAQGLYEDAIASLEDLREQYPEWTVIARRIAELRIASEAPAEPLEDASYSLAQKLAEELEQEPRASAGSDILDVEQVFAQFKKGVKEQVDEADSATHFDLGIAYKEMALLDDAISEFQVAMRDPTRECACHTMVGLCHMEQGRPQDAINAFRAGLQTERKVEREELALYFELANAHEVLGDNNEALYFFEKVRKRDATFRSVSQRIRKVQSAMAFASAPEPSDEDELDAAFDDLMKD